MWKKDEGPEQSTGPRPDMAQSFDRPPTPRTSTGERASIGRSITIQGEVTGDEDLLIQGRVNGSVNLKQHAVTVGPEGEVKADITGRIVTVEGRVHGNLKAEEQVILRSSALVEGDITAPRVVLEDGARFRGGVDMGETVNRGNRAGAASAVSGGSASSSAGDTAARPEVRAASADVATGGKKEGAAEASARAGR